MHMLQALILDIDGVIVGDRQGYNFPDPHPNVISAMEAIRQRGIYISLCTAKPAFAIKNIIAAAHLDNVHITDGGAVIANPIGRTVAAQHGIAPALAGEVLSYYRQAGVYVELYTASDYYIPAAQQCDITAKHSLTLQRPPRHLPVDCERFLGQHPAVKLFLIVRDEAGKAAVAQSFQEKFAANLTLSWTVHPNTLPWQFGIVTAQGISKQQGAREIAQVLEVPLAATLGVGDTEHDWQFMQLCGYAAAMGNASGELKALVQQRRDTGFIGPSVNENGVLDIFRHFRLI